MPLVHAFFLVLALAAVVILCRRYKVMPLLALMGTTAVYCLIQGEDPHWFAKEFGQGFSQSVAASGLVVLAGAMIAALAEESGGSLWLYAKTQALRDTVGPISLAAPVALIAGLGGTTISAYAMATPLIRAISGGGRRIALAAGLLVGTSQSTLIPSPIPIAAMAILGADWRLMLAFGIPTALVHAVAGMVALHHAHADDHPDALPAQAHPARPAAIGLAMATGVVATLLILSSIGQMPSEPLGSGALREKILGSGRPFVLILAGVGIMLASMRRWRTEMVSQDGWLAQAVTSGAMVILLVGAAGGLQMILEGDGTAELLSESLLALPVGILLPFVVAALGKALHGSSLTAAITTAGMMQPLAVPLGLGDPSGRALMALAVGVGALAVPHINDGFFWVVGDQAKLSPGHTLKRFTALAMIQAAGAMAFLIAVSVSR